MAVGQFLFTTAVPLPLIIVPFPVTAQKIVAVLFIILETYPLLIVPSRTTKPILIRVIIPLMIVVEQFFKILEQLPLKTH